MAGGVVVCGYCIQGRHAECPGRETPPTDCACIVCREVQAETKAHFLAAGMNEKTATALAAWCWPEPEDEDSTPPGTVEATLVPPKKSKD